MKEVELDDSSPLAAGNIEGPSPQSSVRVTKAWMSLVCIFSGPVPQFE